jgi:hypothetical protein
MRLIHPSAVLSYSLRITASKYHENAILKNYYIKKTYTQLEESKREYLAVRRGDAYSAKTRKKQADPRSTRADGINGRLHQPTSSVQIWGQANSISAP